MKGGAKAPLKTGQLVDRVRKAESDITTAERDLEGVLHAVEVLPRAQKTTISKAVGDAFAKLRDAKKNLVELEAALKKSDA